MWNEFRNSKKKRGGEDWGMIHGVKERNFFHPNQKEMLEVVRQVETTGRTREEHGDHRLFLISPNFLCHKEGSSLFIKVGLQIVRKELGG